MPRGGAQPGDDIYVTGTIGDSALALQQLQAGNEPPPDLRQRHLNPTARVVTGRKLAEAGIPTAMIDISDGLLGDLDHIRDQSGVGARVELSALPLSELFRDFMAEKKRLIELALSGGEDYELLFSATPDRQEEISAVAQGTGVPISKIGTIVARGAGLALVEEGEPVDLPQFRGYKHFPETL